MEMIVAIVYDVLMYWSYAFHPFCLLIVCPLLYSNRDGFPAGWTFMLPDPWVWITLLLPYYAMFQYSTILLLALSCAMWIDVIEAKLFRLRLF